MNPSSDHPSPDLILPAQPKRLLDRLPYARFIGAHPKILSFGILLTLFSSFGQTFLISIFVPQILASFALSSGQFGALYAIATLSSALCLPFFGRLIDQTDLRRYSLTVAAGLALACLTVSMAQNVWMLFLGILGLRLTGQGLLTLTASTTMARTFTQFRGKALSVSALGFPIGEGLLPLAVVFLIQAFGWRLSWGILSLFIGLVLLPLILQLLKKDAPSIPIPIPIPHSAPPPPQSPPHSTPKQPIWTRRQVLSHGQFYGILPATLLLPFILTGLFLYQIPLAQFKGWPPALMASGFVGFAVGRLVFSLLTGPVLDRFGAARLFPFYLLPLAIGLATLHLSSAPLAAFVYLTLAGISQGMAGTITGALWAELYGTLSLGSIKSLISMLGILSTALSPLLLGQLIQHGISFSLIIPALIAVILLASLLSFITAFKLRQGSTAQ